MQQMMDYYFKKDKCTADEMNRFLKLVNQKHLPSVFMWLCPFFHFTDQTLPLFYSYFRGMKLS